MVQAYDPIDNDPNLYWASVETAIIEEGELLICVYVNEKNKCNVYIMYFCLVLYVSMLVAMRVWPCIHSLGSSLL